MPLRRALDLQHVRLLPLHQKKTLQSGKVHSFGSNVPGIAKLVRGASSDMTAFGSTNAPVDTSCISGVEGEVGFVARTTLAK